MPRKRIKSWLLCYDIADPRRLQRIHRYVKSIAIPLQYSVFLLHSSEAELRHIKTRLAQLIEKKQDDIRIYPMHHKPKKYIIGKGLFPADIMLINNGIDHLK